MFIYEFFYGMTAAELSLRQHKKYNKITIQDIYE